MSYNASRFGASTLGYKTSGIAAYMGLLPAILAKREEQLAEANELQAIFSQKYAATYMTTLRDRKGRPNGAVMNNCTNLSTVKVFANPRAYRKAMHDQH